MGYIWDVNKAAITLKERNIDFADCVGVFEDDHSLYIEDLFPSYGEERFIAIGMDFLGRILTVAYTYRDEDIRIISARKATTNERRAYEQQER